MSARATRRQLAFDILQRQFPVAITMPKPVAFRSTYPRVSPGELLRRRVAEAVNDPSIGMDDFKLSRADNATLLKAVEEWLAKYAELVGGGPRPSPGTVLMERSLFYWSLSSGPAADTEGVVGKGTIMVRRGCP